MSVVRATALSNFCDVVRQVGGDPDAILSGAGIDPEDAGRVDVFLPLQRVVLAVDEAAARTATADFGRRLGLAQGIDILGPVGVAARTAANVSDALGIVERFLAAYSPALSFRVVDLDTPARCFVEYQVLDTSLPATRQHAELALGVILQILRFLLGGPYRPQSVHLPHDPLSPAADYRNYFGCRAVFAERAAGFTVLRTDLRRPLNPDKVAHDAVVRYLETIVGDEIPTVTSVQTLVRQLLPSGRVSLEFVAKELGLHPKTLQRRLAANDSTFAALVDDIRKDTAERFLRDTSITMTHLAHELGYAEQSVLTRSCHRWFGCGPAGQRRRLRGGAR